MSIILSYCGWLRNPNHQLLDGLTLVYPRISRVSTIQKWRCRISQPSTLFRGMNMDEHPFPTFSGLHRSIRSSQLLVQQGSRIIPEGWRPASNWIGRRWCLTSMCPGHDFSGMGQSHSRTPRRDGPLEASKKGSHRNLQSCHFGIEMHEHDVSICCYEMTKTDEPWPLQEMRTLQIGGGMKNLICDWCQPNPELRYQYSFLQKLLTSKLIPNDYPDCGLGVYGLFLVPKLNSFLCLPRG